VASAVPQYNRRPSEKKPSYDVSPEEWAALNPYGQGSSNYSPEEKPQIEELQRQWARFLEYLPWLKVFNYY